MNTDLMVQTDMFGDDLVVRAGDDDRGWTYLEQLLGFTTPSTMSVSEALRHNEIMACVDVLAQDISKAEIQLRERLPDGGERIVNPDEHWLAELLALEPNRYHTWPEFTQMIVSHMALLQNAFIAKEMTRGGRVTSLIPIVPGYTQILVDDKSGDLFYRITAGTNFQRAQLGELAATLSEDQVIHLRTRLWDGLYGLSTISLGTETMALNKTIADYQKSLYSNFGQTRGVFTTDSAFNGKGGDEAFRRLKEQLTERMRKFRQNADPILLENGMKYQSVTMNADQAEVSKSRESGVLDAARMFRIPPHKIMHTNAVKYENLEAMEKQYVRDTLWPVCQVIEDKFAQCLLSRKERLRYFLWVDRDSLEMRDTKAYLEETKVLMHYGLADIDMGRARHNMNPLPGGHGKTRLVPSNMALIDKDGTVTMLSSQQAAGDASGTGVQPPESPETKNVIPIKGRVQ